MRVGFPGGPRLEWYDRNPVGKEFLYQAPTVAPHALVQRFLYTVPTGKKFFLESGLALAIRDAAAGPADLVTAYLFARDYRCLAAVLLTNAVGDRAQMNQGRSVIMVDGDRLQGMTGDVSTGGTINYMVSAHGIEFDA